MLGATTGPRHRAMRLISRHILRSLAAPFFWGVLALTGLLLLNQLAPLIDAFGGRGLDWRVMAEAIILALPALLTLTLPMSVLVATLYAYSTLAADLEMMAMYANGLSVWRMVRPALLAACCITVLNFLVFDQLVPISNTRFRTLRSDVIRKLPTLALRPQQLNELPPTGYVLRAGDISNEGGRLLDVSIWDLRRLDGRRVIHADSGRMAQSADGTDLLMTLYHGEILDFTSSDPTRVERTSFVVNQVTIADVQTDFERSDAQLERGDRERSGCELLDGITDARWALDNADGRRQQLTRRDLRQLMALPPVPPQPVQPRPEFPPHCGKWRGVQRALERVLLPGNLEAQAPVAQQQEPQQQQQAPQDSLTRRRLGDSLRLRRLKDSINLANVTPEGDSTVPQDPAAQQPPPGSADSSDAVAIPLGEGGANPYLVDPAQIPGLTADPGIGSSMVEVSGARMQAAEALRITREYDVEYHKKFAIPLGSICFVLVGVALALKFPGSGIGLVIGGSLLIFLTFYVLLIGGESLADKGIISATTAMYAPVALFTLGGLLAVASANREMGTARSAGIGEWLADLWRNRKTRA